MENLDKEMGKHRAELEMLQDTLKKRQTQLALVDRDLEQQLQARHRNIKVCYEFNQFG